MIEIVCFIITLQLSFGFYLILGGINNISSWRIIYISSHLCVLENWLTMNLPSCLRLCCYFGVVALRPLLPWRRSASTSLFVCFRSKNYFGVINIRNQIVCRVVVYNTFYVILFPYLVQILIFLLNFNGEDWTSINHFSCICCIIFREIHIYEAS